MDHSPEFYALIKQRPTAFVLLAVIADRARKVPLDIDDGLQVGEAFIGDYTQYSATPQSYRTDKKYLERLKIATFKSTNRGTIAKIVNSSIFNISREALTNRLTDNQQADNMQLTTKQEERNQIKEKGVSQATEKNAFFQNIATKSTQSLSQSLNKEDYWDLHAPRIAEEMEIESGSIKYLNAEEDWVKKGKTINEKSIRAFLENANDYDKNERY